MFPSQITQQSLLQPVQQVPQQQEFFQQYPVQQVPSNDAVDSSSVVYTPWESLPNFPPQMDMNQLLQILKDNFENKKNWKGQFDAFDNLRIINKYSPQDTMNLFFYFGSHIILHLENVKSLHVTKNAMIFIREVFTSSRNAKLSDEIIGKIIPILMAKIHSEKSLIKDEAVNAVREFTQNCLSDGSFIVICKLCFDKNVNVCENALKILAKLLENVGENITKLLPDTLQIVMKTLTQLLDGKRSNMQNWSFEICGFLYKLVGNDNYLNLMNFLLTPEESAIMARVIEKKKQPTKPRESFADYLKKSKASVSTQQLLQQQQQQQLYLQQQNQIQSPYALNQPTDAMQMQYLQMQQLQQQQNSFPVMGGVTGTQGFY